MSDEIREKAALERSRAVVARTDRPAQRRDRATAADAPCSPDRRTAPATAPLPATVDVQASDRADGPTLRGYASAYERPFDMWDMFGPYTEIVHAGAAEATLRAEPDVKFLFNHTGMPMARTRDAGTLQLSEDDHGLVSVAQPLMSLSISQEIVAAAEAKLLDQMSFAFSVTRGAWSADFTEYHIHEFDLDRGDTSIVTYGANPYTDIALERADIGKAKRTLERLARAATVDDSEVAQLLGYFTAIDNIVDEAQEKVAALLGVPNPDDDEAADAADAAVRSMTPAQRALARRVLAASLLDA